MTSQQFGILRIVLMIFGSKEDARTWLHRKYKMFDDQSAWELMQTAEGTERVRDLVNRLAGFLSVQHGRSLGESGGIASVQYDPGTKKNGGGVPRRFLGTAGSLTASWTAC